MEYGGYLPLELRGGKEYHNVKEKNRKRLNSGRTAIYDTLCFMHPKTVWVPHYICDTVIAAIEQSGCAWRRYFIDDDFMIKNREDLPIGRNDCLILVNYFGLHTENMMHLVQEYTHTNLIIDNTQAFFAPPILQKNVYNIYSCRKFIGTADGAYVIGENLSPQRYEKDYSGGRASFLLTSLERGTDYAYQESKKNEETMQEHREMSELTKQILKAADYRSIQRKRRENYEFLFQILKDSNRLYLPLGNQVPYCFPLLLSKQIREELLAEKLYLPLLWEELLKPEYRNTRERELSEKMLCLPIDQRYGKRDMSIIAEIIKKRVN